jgi:hypothetical protein
MGLSCPPGLGDMPVRVVHDVAIAIKRGKPG